jgi:transcriptional regulator with XRE-family HTH domain
MAARHGRTTTRRRLRVELRTLRTRRKLSVEDVTKEVEWSPSKLIRIEGGQVGMTVSDLNALLAVYGVKDRDLVEELRELARASRQRAWWSKYQRHIPAAYQEFIGAEADATSIFHYHPTTVPGLLQTHEYASAIIEATSLDPLSAEVIEVRSEVRMLRQRHVLDRDNPPDLTVILDEAVLRRNVGGPKAMREQLEYLIEIAGERNSVTLMVVPFDSGPHPGLMGAFALLEYDDDRDHGVLCMETAAGNVITKDQPKLIERYRRAADALIKIALPEDRALDFLQRVSEKID